MSNPQNDEDDIEKKDNTTMVENQDKLNFVSKSPILKLVVPQLAKILNTPLTEEQLNLCIELIELGVHPKALADVVLHVLEEKKKGTTEPADKAYQN